SQSLSRMYDVAWSVSLRIDLPKAWMTARAVIIAYQLEFLAFRNWMTRSPKYERNLAEDLEPACVIGEVNALSHRRADEDSGLIASHVSFNGFIAVLAVV